MATSGGKDSSSKTVRLREGYNPAPSNLQQKPAPKPPPAPPKKA